MCDAKGTRFFRPWNVDGGTSTIEPIDSTEERGTSPSYVKREEDNESVLWTSTCEEESSAASFSENESPGAAMPGRRRRRRRRSESSDAAASTRSCSVNSEDVAAEGNSLDMLSNFVFNSPPVTDYSVPSVVRENSSLTDDSSFPATSESRSPLATYPADYLQRMALHHAASFAPFTDGSSSSFVPTSVEQSAVRSSSGSAIGQPFYYGFPGAHQFPHGLYASSVEEAVELIHRQDVAAKQMKKLRPKKFRCEHCDVAFSNNGQLKGHIRIHTGERPFKCDAEGCGKSFTRNEELTRHKRIHTGLRPHSCVLCGKRFGRKDHLKKHTRTHDSRDPYRVSALGVFALGHALPQGHPIPTYVYPI